LALPTDSGFAADGPYAAGGAGASGGAEASLAEFADGGTAVQLQFGGSVASATAGASYWVLDVFLPEANPAAVAGSWTEGDLLPMSASLAIYSEEALAFKSVPDGGHEQIGFTLRPNPTENVSSDYIYGGTLSGTFDLVDANKNPAGQENIAESF
jgi:hypothetical protein